MSQKSRPPPQLNSRSRSVGGGFLQLQPDPRLRRRSPEHLTTHLIGASFVSSSPRTSILIESRSSNRRLNFADFVDNDCLDVLSSFPHLQQGLLDLEVVGCRDVDEAGLARCAQLRALRRLHLYNLPKVPSAPGYAPAQCWIYGPSPGLTSR